MINMWSLLLVQVWGILLASFMIYCAKKKSAEASKSKEGVKSKEAAKSAEKVEEKKDEKKEEKKDEEKKDEKKDDEKKDEDKDKKEEEKKSEAKDKSEKKDEKKEEKKDDEKKEDEEKKDEEKEEKKEKKPHVTTEPADKIIFKASNTSQSKLVIKNVHNKKIMFKVKTSDTPRYTFNPIIGTIEPDKSVDVVVSHTAGITKDSKMLIVNTVFTGDENDMAKTFKAIKCTGTDVTIQLIAK